MTVVDQERTLQENGNEKLLISKVKRLGNPISILLLNSDCKIFTVPGIDGCVGYQLVGNCAVVIGDPLCLKEQVSKLIDSFHAYCKEQNWTTVYFLASEAFAHYATGQHLCCSLLQIGSQLNIDPTKFHLKQKLRWKINHSLKAGVIIKEHREQDHSMDDQMKAAMKTWQESKHGFQIYLGSFDLYANYKEKRIFYALEEGKIIGILTMIRLDHFQGWAITSFLALPNTPAGITEHLMCHVFTILSAENCRFLCLGFISGMKIGETAGLNPFSTFFAKLVFTLSRWLFHLDEKSIYLKKYSPTLSKTYILCDDKIGISELLAIKNTLKVKLCL